MITIQLSLVYYDDESPLQGVKTDEEGVYCIVQGVPVKDSSWSYRVNS